MLMLNTGYSNRGRIVFSTQIYRCVYSKAGSIHLCIQVLLVGAGDAVTHASGRAEQEIEMSVST